MERVGLEHSKQECVKYMKKQMQEIEEEFYRHCSIFSRRSYEARG